MSRPLVVVRPQMNLEEASKIMRKRKIKRLPVIEKGRLVGLVTTTDIICSPEVMKLMIRAMKRNLIKEIVALKRNWNWRNSREKWRYKRRLMLYVSKIAGI